MTEPDIVIVADAAAAARTAAERIAMTLQLAVETRDRADWATTGGSAAVGIYRGLAAPPLRGAVPWDHVHTWWGDDRFVPRDHPLSNVKAFDAIVLDAADGEEGTGFDAFERVAIPIANVHPFRTGETIGAGRDAAACAAALAVELRAEGLTEVDRWPVFDLVLLGIGADGHVLSVFPSSAAFDSEDLALAIPAPTHIEPHVGRVTLNPAIVRVAREVIVVASGAAKAQILAEILGSDRDPRRLPAQLARRSGATWILDEAAAAQLPG
ncbi:MAG: 6-phosphogluconolactonase [Candidatus Limnocylindrales bacterium]